MHDLNDNSSEYSRTALFLQLTKRFDERDLRYCIVGDTDAYPEKIHSDIDIVVENGSLAVAKDLLREFAHDLGLQIVQMLQHEQNAFFFVLAYSDSSGNIRFWLPDLCSDYFRDGRRLIVAEELLTNRVRPTDKRGALKAFYVPEPSKEFLYYFLKRVDKQAFTHRHGRHLAGQWKKDPGGSKRLLRKFWKDQQIDLIAAAAETNEWQRIVDALPKLRREIHGKAPLRLRHILYELIRITRRVLYPSGLMVVLFGPDGCGKSTVIQIILRDLLPVFRGTAYFHLRPKLFGVKKGTTNAPVTDPHALPPRGLIASVAKIGYWTYAYLIGHLTQVKMLLIRSRLVIFDRYYHDILVDPRRYRYSRPMWLARIAGIFVPKPSLLILLDAPPETLYARKQEVTFDELVRQRHAYLDLVRTMPYGVIVDSSQPLDNVVLEVKHKILAYMAERNSHRTH